eukprot:gene37044-49983_t
MLRNTFKRGVGIVHGSSNTDLKSNIVCGLQFMVGRSIYVEPMEVVEKTNELKSIQADLKAEEAKICYEMCKTIATHREVIRRCAEAVTALDLYCSRARLGAQLNGIIPEVGNEGMIRCNNARHPVLLLRQSQTYPNISASTSNIIVGNSIELNSSSSSLVISGPNAGGKTIVLKTCGLFALMVQFSIPLPTSRGGRVDLFSDVMADIGDLQSVDGDLSTFSGHLVMCREMLRTINIRRLGDSRDDNVGEEENDDDDDEGSSSDSSGGGSHMENNGLKKPYFLILLDEI